MTDHPTERTATVSKGTVRKYPTAKPTKLPKKLTPVWIDSLPHALEGERRYTVADFGDGMVSGLKIRVTDKGAKSFILWRRYNGSKNPAARSLGSVGSITLSDAREKARQWLKHIAAGEDPARIERRDREAKQADNKITFGVVFEKYLAEKVKGLRKAADIEREMRNDLLPAWKNRPLSEITRRNVIRLIEAVAKRDPVKKRGGPYQAHSVFGHIRAFFNWVITHDIIDGLEISPADKIRPSELIGAKRPRERVLEDHEIKEFWKATDRLGYPFGTLFRLMLMTGQRRGECAEARWREINFKDRTWTIPAERFKSDSEHTVPLTADALALLETIPRWNAGDFLFSTTNGTSAVSGFDYEKRKMFDIMTGSMGDVELKNFVLHDLRRTVRSQLSKLKVQREVAEMVIGHGAKGVERVYNRHKYIGEMQEALAAWNAALREIVK